MSLLDFSRTVEIPVTQVNVSEKTAQLPEPFISGEYYTADGVVYRAFRTKTGLFLMDVNKSWRAGNVWLVNGLFLRAGRLYSGEYVVAFNRAKWQVKPELTALSVESLTLCSVITNKIDFREAI